MPDWTFPTMTDCTQEKDERWLVREGTSEEQRRVQALDPSYAPVDERGVSQGMTFARAYSAFLACRDENGREQGDWTPFFGEDPSALLALAAAQDVDLLQQKVHEWISFLKNGGESDDLSSDRIDWLFSCCVTLAIRLEELKEKLPSEIAMKDMLRNLVRSQLRIALASLAAHRQALNPFGSAKAAPMRILGRPALGASDWTMSVLSTSEDWRVNEEEQQRASKLSFAGVGSMAERARQLARHPHFVALLEQFQKACVRTVAEARKALNLTSSTWNGHEPHYALFLTFLHLLEHARKEMNELTSRHLDFYYRDVLRFKEKPPLPAKAHVLLELAKQALTYEAKAGELFKAGKDALGQDVFFSSDRDVVVNRAKVESLKTIWLKQESPEVVKLHAFPVANSEDGFGAELSSKDKSWHPFFNDFSAGRDVAEEAMLPEPEIGFAIASHYLWLAGGKRTINVLLTLEGSPVSFEKQEKEVACLLAGPEGWIKAKKIQTTTKNNTIELVVELSVSDPAVVPYSEKTHGYGFATNLPILLVKLSNSAHAALKDARISMAKLSVVVDDFKPTAVSNDFGPVDTSKPFQPFGAVPVKGSMLIVGAKEVAQKNIACASVEVHWRNRTTPYNKEAADFTMSVKCLVDGIWEKKDDDAGICMTCKSKEKNPPAIDWCCFCNTLHANGHVDFLPQELFAAASQQGFIGLALNEDFDMAQFQKDLATYIKSNSDNPPQMPEGPTMDGLFINYETCQQIIFAGTEAAASEQNEKTSGECRICSAKPCPCARKASHGSLDAAFFHLAPFGCAKPRKQMSDSTVPLLPQFASAEFYVGIVELRPPQNLALLFQVADGTAAPDAGRPQVRWSCLGKDQWIDFAPDAVDDRTSGLVRSGIVTFAVPREASSSNPLLPLGRHWLRASVASDPKAVCRLRMVAAQALETTLVDPDSALSLPAGSLQAGTIGKLDRPAAAVKKIIQPFAAFGGRSKEDPAAFRIRVSERLRHKDRALTPWDYEHLVLEAFPELCKVKCLSHTQYVPRQPLLNERAPGHVTMIVVAHQQHDGSQRNFLRPLASLALLEDIETFLHSRMPSVVKSLHVANPRFEEVEVSCKVQLRKGLDAGHHLLLLQEALLRFLSPWAFSGGGSPAFAAKTRASAVIGFLERQDCVDAVYDLKLWHRKAEAKAEANSIVPLSDQVKEEVEAGTSVSILASASKHDIGLNQDSRA